MSEIVLETIGNSAAAELEPRGTSRTMVENLVTRLDTMMEIQWLVDPLDGHYSL